MAHDDPFTLDLFNTSALSSGLGLGVTAFAGDLAAEPVKIPFVSVRTPHDNYVMPQDNQRLPEARDVELAGIGHLALLLSSHTADLLIRLCGEPLPRPEVPIRR